MKQVNEYLFTSNVLLLVYRNLAAAIGKMFLIWQIALPVFQIYVAGYAYSALIGDQGITIGSLNITYVSFLTAGMRGFNVMQGSQIVGAISGVTREMACSNKYWLCHLIKFNMLLPIL